MDAPAPRRFPLSRQPGREAPLPHGSPATSSRQRRSNHPKKRDDTGGLWRDYPCDLLLVYDREAPPKSSAIVLDRPCAAGRCFVSGIPPDDAVCGLLMGRCCCCGADGDGWVHTAARIASVQRNVANTLRFTSAKSEPV